jgi:RND family efflux transporter MFP subunit
MPVKRSHIIGLVVLVAALGIGVWFWVYRGQQAQEAAAARAQSAPVVIAVQTTAPRRRGVSRLITLPGDVRPWEETTLYAKVPGYLGTISVDKGDRVKVGQVLAVIRAPELQADVEQARQAYQTALASTQGSRATNLRTAAEQQRAAFAVGKATADYAQMPALVARAKAQLKQAEAFQKQAAEQKNQAEAAREESRAQLARTQGDLDTANAEQKLADVTYARYQGIYDKDPMLIAKQDVDTAESRAAVSRGKVSAAQSAVEAARQHIKAVQSQVDSATSQIEQAQAEVVAAREQVNASIGQMAAMRQQVEVVRQDVVIGRRQQGVTEAKVREAQSQAKAVQTAFGKTSVLADYAHIRAPYTGVVTKRFVDTGAFIQTASTNSNAAAIVTVARMGTVRILINVPEAEARYIKRGSPVMLTMTGQPDKPFKGRVTRTGGNLDPRTRTLLVEVDLPNGDGSIMPGGYATAKVVLETHPDVVAVPSPAVGSDKSGKYLYVVESGKAKRVPITVGFDDGAFTEVADGLRGNEQVVVTGRDNLSPHAPVTTSIWTPPLPSVRK